MKYSLLIAASAILCSSASFASVLSPEQALERVGESNGKLLSKAHNSRYELCYTLKSSEEACVYVFAQDKSPGYLILSADDAATPVLGYSDSETFDAANIPASLKVWLQHYSAEIEMARAGNKRGAALLLPQLPDLAAISPLVKTKWNQGTPYNKDCFTINSDGSQTQSVTGCVATAMAQVMDYFQYPAIGKGEISYKHGDSGTYSMNFAQQDFDWSDMLPAYHEGQYTDAEADAVAYLMKACGYSVKMDYGKGEAGASGASIPGALIDYFGYAPGVTLHTRKFYTYSEWAQMIYKNLSEVGPVIYDGSALDGGHSFICDGYDGNGYFHFNWGWGGMSDGYFVLDALNPDEYGIGGAAGGYNLGQQIILGISPTSTASFAPQLMQTGSFVGKIEGSTLTFSAEESSGVGFEYVNPEDITVSFGVAVTNTSDSSQAPTYLNADKEQNVACKQGSSFRWDQIDQKIDLSSLSMNEGDVYDFTVSTYITDSAGSRWSAVRPMPGNYNYVSVKKTADGYEVVDNTLGELSVSDFKVISSPVYQDMPVKFEALFTNNSSTELTRNYSVVLFNQNDEKCYTMENYSITVDAQTSQNSEWTSVEWYKTSDAVTLTEPTEFTLRLYDNWEGKYVDGIEQTVTVDPQPEDTKVKATLSLPGATEDADGVYVLSSTDFEVAIDLDVESGYFSRSINVDLEVPTGTDAYYSVMSKRFDDIPTLSAGQSQQLTMTMDYSDAESGQEYWIQAWSNGATLGDKIKVKFDLTADGINGLQPDSRGMYNVYGIDGVLLLSTPDYDKIQNLPSGIYIVNGKKIAR